MCAWAGAVRAGRATGALALATAVMCGGAGRGRGSADGAGGEATARATVRAEVRCDVVHSRWEMRSARSDGRDPPQNGERIHLSRAPMRHLLLGSSKPRPERLQPRELPPNVSPSQTPRLPSGNRYPPFVRACSKPAAASVAAGQSCNNFPAPSGNTPMTTKQGGLSFGLPDKLLAAARHLQKTRGPST